MVSLVVSCHKFLYRPMGHSMSLRIYSETYCGVEWSPDVGITMVYNRTIDTSVPW